MARISLCIIVKNEEAVLARCLQSFRGVVEEIVVVDTGSTDRTVDIARAFTPHVYFFEWVDDFSAARNFALSKGTMEYLMWVDADDVLLDGDKHSFLASKQALAPDVDVVMMRYHTAFDAAGNPTFSYYRERLVRRAAMLRFEEPVHEYIALCGNIVQIEAAITHQKPPDANRSERNIRIYEARVAAGEVLSPRGMYYYARELKDHARYSDAAAQFHAFLETKRGWVGDNIAACGALAQCYFALEQHERGFAALMQSFLYATPRAEICCQAGYYFKARAMQAEALYWFELALTLKKPEESWGFMQPDCWGYTPAIECAVLLDALGDPLGACAYNERAALYKPYDEAVIKNRAYFKEKLGDCPHTKDLL